MASVGLMHAIFDRSGLADGEDNAIMTLHYQKHIALAPDVGPITDTERMDIESKFADFIEALEGIIKTDVVLTEFKHFDMPSSAGLLGPATRVNETASVPGTSTADALPPQVACSVTFKTSARKQWGRFYLPGLTTPVLESNGKLKSATADAISEAAVGLCDRSGTGAHLVVFSRSLWAPQEVTEVQVDNVLDIIRRRRFSGVPTYKAHNPT